MSKKCPVRWTVLAIAALLPIFIASCGGGSGSTGPAGPPGAGALDVSTAKAIVATITSVTVPAPPAAATPVVKFKLVNEVGSPLTGLQASALGFAIAKLVPAGTQLAAVPPQTVTPSLQNSSQWQSYIYRTATPAASLAAPFVVTGTTPQPQATTERGTGALVDNGDGTYQYTFTKDISKDSAVSYDPTLTHRVGFEIRGLAPANSPTYTFQPSTGATSNIASREIVADQTCTNCHMQLAFHGGARTEVRYCVLCHNPSSIEASTGNSLDFKVMFHKIHMGASLPSVTTGGSYYIAGFQNSVSDYSRIQFPTGDLRTCYTCHNESNPSTPDTVGWRTTPSIEACGSCHDDVNFQTGLNHSSLNIGGVTNNDCAKCHGQNPTVSFPIFPALKVDDAHLIPERQFAKRFAYNILSVSNTGPGQTPVIKFSVTDPTNSNASWNLLADEPFTQCAGDAQADTMLMIAWSTMDYTNTGIGANGGEIDIPVACAAPLPIANGDGTFTIASPQPIPSDAAGTAGIYFQGHPSHDFNDGRGVQAIPVPNAIAYSSITDATPAPRRTVVDVNKCNACHDQLNPLAHGGDRVQSVQGCPFCHGPNATDQAARASLGVVSAADAAVNAPDRLQEQSIDFKVLIHAIHDGPDRGLAQSAPFVVYHDGAVVDFTTITAFPGPVNNCLACHVAGTFYPPSLSNPTPLASTIRTVDATGAALPNQVAVTAGAAVCSACHASTVARQHMQQNGANFAAVKDANNNVTSSETCRICHGPGTMADVLVVHHLSNFR